MQWQQLLLHFDSFKCRKPLLVITIFLFFLHMQDYDSSWAGPQEFSSPSSLLLTAVSWGKWTSLFQFMPIVSHPPSMHHGEAQCLHRDATDWEDHIWSLFTWNNQPLVLQLSCCTCLFQGCSRLLAVPKMEQQMGLPWLQRRMLRKQNLLLWAEAPWHFEIISLRLLCV